MEDPVFNRDNFDDQQIGHLEFIVNSPQYQQTFRPFLENGRKMYTELLLDPRPDTRRKYGGDEYLRCGENNLKKFIDFLDNMITEAREDRVTMTRDNELHADRIYTKLVEQGIIRTAGQVTPGGDGYAQDEEF